MNDLISLVERKRVRFNFGNLNGKRIMILSPHADDETIGCGGTILKIISERGEVDVVLFSHAQGTTRAQEFNQAKKCLSYRNAYYLQQEDGKLLQSVHAIQPKLLEIIRNRKPDIIMTPYLLDQTIDHFAVNYCLCETLGKVNKVADTAVYFYEVWNLIQYPDYYIDISGFFDQKMTALCQYRSQEEQYAILEKSVHINALRAQLSFRKQYRYSECFRRVDVNQLIAICEDLKNQFVKYRWLNAKKEN